VATISTEEQEDPYAKWVPMRQRVLALVALPALLPPITSTMYLPTLNVVIADLETTEEMVAFTLSAYALTVGFCPLAWGPLSDRYGRRGVLLSCLLIFIVAAIIAGSAQHVYTLIGARMLQGLGLSAAGIVGAGSIADVYPPAIRGQAMGWYSVTVLLGTVLGPVVGGTILLAQTLRWPTLLTLVIASRLQQDLLASCWVGEQSSGLSAWQPS
jgi:MFS family permease